MYLTFSITDDLALWRSQQLNKIFNWTAAFKLFEEAKGKFILKSVYGNNFKLHELRISLISFF